MMNKVWAGMVIVGIIAGILTGKGAMLIDSMITGAGEAVMLCINLAGAYMLWMGLMEIAKDIGLIEKLAKLVQPLMKKLFPNAGKAVAPITLNLAANFFGMGSAATPFGLEAMAQLQKVNPNPLRASNDMCMFIAMNASALELLPTTILAMRSAAGSSDPYCVVLPTFLASIASAVSAILVCKLLEKRTRGESI